MATVVPQAIHDKTLAKRLAEFRKSYIDKSQNQAAVKLGIAQSALSYMESGKMPIKYEFITQLVKEYGLNQDWLSNGNGKPTEKNPPKANLLTDINALNLEIASLKKFIKILEINQTHILKRMEQMEKELANKK